MFDSLRSRLALLNLLITLLGLLVVVALFTNLVAQRGIDVKKHDLANQSRSIAKQADQLFRLRAGLSDLVAQIDSESRLLGERIIVVGRTGKVAYDSASHTPFFRGVQVRPDMTALTNGRNTSSSVKSQNVIVFQSPLHSTVGPGPVGAILFVARTDDVSLGWWSLLRVAAIGVAVALIVWLLIGFYFTFSISRPLRRIMDATAEMARGNYAARVNVRGHSEISRLARSFNQMAQQIQQSNQVLKDFLANASHDLRTPLTMIAGFSQALLDGTAGPHEVEGPATVIHDEAIKMQHLVDDLLQLTRLESGLLTLNRHLVEIGSFIQSSIDHVQRVHAGAPKASIQYLPAPMLPRMDVDPERMERVLRNLLDNALQYTPVHGTVTVEARRAGSRWIEIIVSDTGTGIPPEDVPRIFERFYRADKGRERARGHSGLGLAIVKEIVEAHGGQVTVQSSIGVGTTFQLTVPRAAGLTTEAEEPSTRESVRQAAT